MLRMSLPTRASSRAGIGSTLALALALAGGTAVATVALTGPALAQRQQRQEGPSLSRKFQPVYQAVADATNTGSDYAGAKAQVPAMLAAIESDYDRFFAGNILLQLGGKASDKALQKQGIALMLQSGQGSPTDTGLLRYVLGSFYYEDGDYAGALREAQASLATGYQGNFAQQQDPWLLAADAYIKLGQNQQGAAFLKTTIDQRRAVNQPIRDLWLTRAIALAYQANMATEATELSALLVETNPNPTTWMQALQVVNALQSDEQARLDVMRLMALTGALSQRGEFERYVAVLDPRVLPTEVGKVLEAGVAKGVFTTSDPFYTENKRVIDTRAATEAGLAADYAAEAASASNGRPAFNAGDVYLSLGQYAKAEEMFALALQKGGVDRDQILTRLGIAQVQQGKNAEAKATFAQVAGQRAAIARMWSVYANSRA